MGQNDIYTLVEWAEMSFCNTVNGQVGPLGWAEIMSLFRHPFEAKKHALAAIVANKSMLLELFGSQKA